MGTIDELTRLEALLQEGAISQDEFEMLKKNAISESQTENSTQKKTKRKTEKEAEIEIAPEQKVIPSNPKNAVLKEITCSNCGAELLFDPGTQLASCNFCNSRFEIKNSEEKSVIIPEGIVPFSVSKKDYESRVLEYLSEGDYTPIDILESSVFSSVNGIYLPVWYYSGKYRGNWSASSGYNYIEEYQVKENNKWVTKQRVVTDWRPSSGNCDGDLFVTGYAAGERKSELVVFTWDTVLRKIKIKPFDSKYTVGFNLLEFKLDEHESWEDYGTEAADHYVRSQVYPRIPGDLYKDVHVEAVYDKEKPIRVYYPVWITYYKYNGKEYYVWMDGSNPSRIFGTKPEDAGIKSKSEFFLKIFKYWWIVVFVWVLWGLISYFSAPGGENGEAQTLWLEKHWEGGDGGFWRFRAIFVIGGWGFLYILGIIQKKVVIGSAKKRRAEVLNRIKKNKK